MARSNVAVSRPAITTHEGARAKRTDTLAQLRRSVLSCLLWEREFYESGVTIAERIDALAKLVNPGALALLCIAARNDYKLRHAPLWLLTSLIARASECDNPALVAETIEQTIQRTDELAELIAMYWKSGKRPLSAQMKKGLARAFTKFDAYGLAKYDRDAAIKLRDVLFLVHAKPIDDAQAALWKSLVDGTLAPPDTWEVALSSGADKRETFERLLREQKLGYLALLRNLRNMVQAGVDDTLVRNALLARKGAHLVLPFRYVAAARAVPQYETVLDEALSASLDDIEPLSGMTVVLVDVSKSMEQKLSDKSDLSRLDAAATLASIIPGKVRVFTFSTDFIEVPPRRGMAGVDAVSKSQAHLWTYLASAMKQLNARATYDRLIVITDEQSQDGIGTPRADARHAYLINVASAKNGVDYGKPWLHIDGFSENVIRFIHEHERANIDEAE